MRREDYPIAKIKQELLEEEGNICQYCGYEFGTPYSRNGRFRGYLKPTLDHTIPFSFTMTTKKEESVLACQVCNMLKGSKIFNNFADMIFFILKQWNRKGFIICDDPFPGRTKY